jgi:hypothetical protein
MNQYRSHKNVVLGLVYRETIGRYRTGNKMISTDTPDIYSNLEDIFDFRENHQRKELHTYLILIENPSIELDILKIWQDNEFKFVRYSVHQKYTSEKLYHYIITRYYK